MATPRDDLLASWRCAEDERARGGTAVVTSVDRDGVVGCAVLRLR